MIGHMQLIDRMNGQAFEFSQRIVHFGNIADFLFPEDNNISKEISVLRILFITEIIVILSCLGLSIK